MSTMDDVMWGFASLAVAGAAVAVIATPVAVGMVRGVSRAVRSARRLRASLRGRSSHGTHRSMDARDVHLIPALGAADDPVTIAVPSRPLPAPRAGAAYYGLGAETTPGTPVRPVRPPSGHAGHWPLPEPEPEPEPERESELTPAQVLDERLEEAAQAQARHVPTRVLAEWAAGPLVMPGHYPLAGGLLTAREVADIMARHGDASWRGSLVTGAGPMDPRSNGWN